jgi:hypothetical protein
MLRRARGVNSDVEYFDFRRRLTTTPVLGKDEEERRLSCGLYNS